MAELRHRFLREPVLCSEFGHARGTIFLLLANDMIRHLMSSGIEFAVERLNIGAPLFCGEGGDWSS